MLFNVYEYFKVCYRKIHKNTHAHTYALFSHESGTVTNCIYCFLLYTCETEYCYLILQRDTWRIKEVI